MTIRFRLVKLEAAADPRIGITDDLILALDADDPEAAWAMAWAHLPDHRQREVSAILSALQGDGQ